VTDQPTGLRDRIRDRIRDHLHATALTHPDYHPTDCRICLDRADALMAAVVQPKLDQQAAEIQRLHVEVARFRQAWENAMSDGDRQVVQRLGLHNQIRELTKRAEAAEAEAAQLRAHQQNGNQR